MKFTIQSKNAAVFPANSPDRPVICLNTYTDNGAALAAALAGADINLVVISGLDWDNEMSPWEIPPIHKNAAPCKGGAGAYLRLLLDEILPEAEKHITGTPPWRGLAGYSLAGLFAVYAAYKTDVFSRIASVSGSLWFPGFKEFVFANAQMKKPECMYFSLGDRECRTRNPFLKTVQQNTAEIEQFYHSSGIKTIFELNEGNHFVNSIERTAKGLEWLLTT